MVTFCFFCPSSTCHVLWSHVPGFCEASRAVVSNSNTQRVRKNVNNLASFSFFLSPSCSVCYSGIYYDAHWSKPDFEQLGWEVGRCAREENVETAAFIWRLVGALSTSSANRLLRSSNLHLWGSKSATRWVNLVPRMQQTWRCTFLWFGRTVNGPGFLAASESPPTAAAPPLKLQVQHIEMTCDVTQKRCIPELCSVFLSLPRNGQISSRSSVPFLGLTF